MPDRVLAAMHRPSPNIYAGELPEMMPGIIRDVKRVARTDGHVAIYVANGHGAWEAALTNVLSPGDRALVLATGRFALGWADMATRLGVNCDIVDFGRRAPVDLGRLEQALAADDAGSYRAVLVTHVDTATSVLNDIAAIRQVIEAAGHPALLMVDCIASLACDRFEMDAWGADVMVAGSQKGLMTPPGLGFVFFNDRADAARETARRVTPYWDWRPRMSPEEFYQFFAGTAPTHHLYGLRAALDMIGEEGMEAIWRRHDVLAQAVWAAFETWGSGGPLELNVADPAVRSRAVTAIRAGSEKGEALRAWVEKNAGLTLGLGIGMAPPGSAEAGAFFRVAHMGHVNAHMVLGALGVIEAGLRAVDLPFKEGGVTAAAELIARKA